jgi:amino acid transporter
MGKLSGEVGGVLWAPLVLALLLALLTAGSYAELVTKYPKAGGAAVFAERAFKQPLVSFLVGFSMLAAGVTSAAGLALAFSGDYLTTFVPVPAVPAALVFLVLIGCLNARGISESLKSNVVMTCIEVTGLVIVVVTVAGALADRGLAERSGPLLAVVSATGVGVPDWLFSAIALVAVANGALLTMIMASRLTYGMAQEGLLPGALAKVLPNRRTPWAAIVATTVVAMLLTLVGELQTLAETVVLLLLFVFISTNVSVLVLRRDTVEHDHFRVWTVVPVFGVASCVLLLTQQSGQVWMYAGILLGVGAVLHLVAKWSTRRAAE